MNKLHKNLRLREAKLVVGWKDRNKEKRNQIQKKITKGKSAYKQQTTRHDINGKQTATKDN